jgi:hypothetical protein
MRALRRCLVCAVVFALNASAYGACKWNVQPSAIAFGGYSVFSTTNLATVSQFSIDCKSEYGKVTLTRGSSGVYTFPIER